MSTSLLTPPVWIFLWLGCLGGVLVPVGAEEPPLGRELLRNGGFEEPFPETLNEKRKEVSFPQFGWSDLSPEMIATSGCRSGQRCVRLTGRRSFNSLGQMQERVPARCVLRLQFYFNTNQKAQAVLGQATVGWKTISGAASKTPPANVSVMQKQGQSGWQCFETFVVTPSRSEDAFSRCWVGFTSLGQTADAELCIDDVSLRQVRFALEGIDWSDGMTAIGLELPRRRFAPGEVMPLRLAVESRDTLKRVTGRVECLDADGRTMAEVPVSTFDVPAGAVAETTVSVPARALAEGAARLKIHLTDGMARLDAMVIESVTIVSELEAETAAVRKAIEAISATVAQSTGASATSFARRVQAQRARWLVQDAREAYSRGKFALARQLVAAAEAYTK